MPPPFSTGVCRNEEPSPEGKGDKEISLSQFMSSLFKGVGQLLPGDFAGLLMSRPGSSQLGTPVAKWCRRGFLEVYRVNSLQRIPSSLPTGPGSLIVTTILNGLVTGLLEQNQ